MLNVFSTFLRGLYPFSFALSGLAAGSNGKKRLCSGIEEDFYPFAKSKGNECFIYSQILVCKKRGGGVLEIQYSSSDLKARDSNYK